MRKQLVCFWFVSAACAHTQPSSENSLAELQKAIAAPVASAEQNARNSALVEQVSEDESLQGLTREQVSDALGRGEDCARHPLCREQGFEDDDWYYEVGQVGAEYVRVRPVLIVGFDRFGKVVRTYNLRVE